MSIRYISNLAVILTAGFLVVATQAFATSTVAWLTFGIAAGLTVTSAYLLASGRLIRQRVSAAASIVLGAWTVVASLVFAPSTILWLGFGSALAFVGLGVASLTVDEVSRERVAESSEVGLDRVPARHARRDPLARRDGKAVAA